MADKKAAVDKIVEKQTPAESTLTSSEKKAVLARRLQAVQGSKNNTPKLRRALNRLAANVNK